MTCCETYRYSFTITRSDAELAENIAKGREELANHHKVEGDYCEKQPEYTYWSTVECNTYHIHYGPSTQAK